MSRVPAISRPRMSRIASDGVASISASVLPVNISVTMDDAARLIVQPSPSNEIATDTVFAIHLQVETSQRHRSLGCRPSGSTDGILQRAVMARVLVMIQDEVDLRLAIHGFVFLVAFNAADSIARARRLCKAGRRMLETRSDQLTSFQLLVSPLNRHAHQIPPLRPTAVVIPHVRVAQQILEHKPGVAGALADAAVGDDAVAGFKPCSCS